MIKSFFCTICTISFDLSNTFTLIRKEISNILQSFNPTKKINKQWQPLPDIQMNAFIYIFCLSFSMAHGSNTNFLCWLGHLESVNWIFLLGKILQYFFTFDFERVAAVSPWPERKRKVYVKQEIFWGATPFIALVHFLCILKLDHVQKQTLKQIHHPPSN